jgi:exopolysaccharide biosynthesis polyprenyl glycosylphosphotransferase
VEGSLGSSGIDVSTVAERTDIQRQARDRRFGRGRARILAAADLVAFVLAYTVTYLAAQAVAAPAVVGPSGLVVSFAASALLMWFAVFAAYGLYERDSERVTVASLDEVRGLFHALLAGSLVLLFSSQAIARFSSARLYTPLEAVLFVAIALPLVPLLRGAVRTWALPNVMRPRRAIIVGGGDAAKIVERKLRAHPEHGFEVVGFCDDEPAGTGGLLCDRTGLAKAIERHDIDWLILAEDADVVGNEHLLDLIGRLPSSDVKVTIVPQYADIFTSNAVLDDIEGMPLVNLPRPRLSRTARTVKRSFDLVVSSALLFLLAPILLAVAAAIKIDSRGPVLYRQPRRGRAGSEFEILKFRTMKVGADRERDALAGQNEVTGPLFKMRRDPRVTRVGALLRRASVDELPQLWNVLRGDMSLVGPRPFVIAEADQITGWARRRLDLTPGITGLWQVLGRNDIPYDEMVKFDFLYVTGWSLWWDVEILCKTVPAVLRGKGAY